MPITLRPLTEELVQSVLAFPPPLHRHRAQEIVILTQGGGRHRIDAQCQEVEAPAALLIARGKQHQLFPRPGTRGWIIGFNEDLLPVTGNWIFSQFFESTVIDLAHPAGGHPALRVAELLHDLLGQSVPGGAEASDQVLLALIKLLQGEFQADVLHRAGESCAEFRLFIQFLEHLEQHYLTQKVASYYARLLGIPLKRLSRLSQGFLGKTVKQMIEERCLGEAKRLLAFSDTPIKAIASDLGYVDQSYFTKVFRKATGEAPTDFRRSRSEPTGK